MRKIIFIITALMMSFAMLIVSSPKTYASPTWNNVYIFDALNETKDTTTLTIEEGTNVFTLNGTATSIKSYILPNLYDQNVNGSQLDSTKSYLIWYEYISGSVTTSTSSATAIDTGANSDYARSIRNVSTDYQINKGYVIPPNGVSLTYVTLSANATAVNLKYKLHIIEIDDVLVDQYDLVNDLTTITSGTLSVSFEDSNTITMNGNVASLTEIDLSSRIHDDVKDANKIYIFAFDYISGTLSSTYNRARVLSVNNILNIDKANASIEYNNAVATNGLSTLKVGLTAAETVTNLKYKIYVHEVELYSESSTPGESTTPPTGLSLSGSFYEGSLYYNTAVNPHSSKSAVYLATTTGNTFDLNILTENLVFTSTDENIRFYIGRISGGEENIAGTDDFIISKDATFLTIARHIDGTLYDSIHAPLYDVDYIMIEYGTAAAETYSVVFNSNGGSSVATQTVLEGNLASVPPEPTRPGYDFVGWVTDTEAETVYNFSTPVTSDVTLYALWLDNGTQVYTITFIADGGTQVNAIEIEDGDIAVAPTAPLKSGYSFLNWVITGTETVFDFSSAITSDLSLTAVWETSEVTFILITFNSNGGSFVASQVLYDGDLPVEPTDPTRSGYTFAGWYKDIALTQAFSFVGDAVTEDLSLYAKWTPVSGGGDPITPDEGTSSSVWLYVGLGALVLAVFAGSELKKKGNKR